MQGQRGGDFLDLAGGRGGGQGDMSMAPDDGDEDDPPVLHRPAPTKAGPTNPLDDLRRALYDPPVSLDQLAVKLQVSMVTNSPRITQSGFVQRRVLYDCLSAVYLDVFINDLI